jgi:hypothetical protein
MRSLAKLSNPFRRGIFVCALFGLFGASYLHAETLKGLAFVTSLKGELQQVSAGGISKKSSLHDSLTLDDSELFTKGSSQAIIVLSNTLALGLGAQTNLRIPRYEQAPFTEEKASVSIEPSTSLLDLRLISGTCVIVATEQAPLSEFKVQLPIGYAIFRNVTVRIEYYGRDIKLNLVKGTMTYFPGSNNRQRYLSAPMHTTINADTLKLEVLPEAPAEVALSPEASSFVEAVTHASKRVYFPSLNAESATQPVPIVDPYYYKKPIARPYEFKSKSE